MGQGPAQTVAKTNRRAMAGKHLIEDEGALHRHRHTLATGRVDSGEGITDNEELVGPAAQPLIMTPAALGATAAVDRAKRRGSLDDIVQQRVTQSTRGAQQLHMVGR